MGLVTKRPGCLVPRGRRVDGGSRSEGCLTSAKKQFFVARLRNEKGGSTLEHSKTITLGHSTALELEDRLIWADSDGTDAFMEAVDDLIGTTQKLNVVGTNCALLDRMDEVLCSTAGSAACRGRRTSSGPATPPQPAERRSAAVEGQVPESGPTSSLAECTSRRRLSCTTRPRLAHDRLPLDSNNARE
jgi:hypothetical protein